MLRLGQALPVGVLLTSWTLFVPAALAQVAQTAPPPALAGQPSNVQVEFAPEHADDAYTVTVDAPSAHTCQAPCALALPPGDHQLLVKGAGSFERPLVVPQSGKVA